VRTQKSCSISELEDDPVTERSWTPLGEGVCIMCYQSQRKIFLSLFVEQQKKEEERKVGILRGNFTLLGGDAVKS
jgi:hypothetical protein